MMHLPPPKSRCHTVQIGTALDAAVVAAVSRAGIFCIQLQARPRVFDGGGGGIYTTMIASSA